MTANTYTTTTTWNEEEKLIGRTVKAATVTGLVIAAIIIFLFPTLLPLAKIGMIAMSMGISYISSALIRAQQGQPIYELNCIGLGLGILATGLFFITSIL